MNLREQLQKLIEIANEQGWYPAAAWIETNMQKTHIKRKRKVRLARGGDVWIPEQMIREGESLDRD